MVKVIFALMLMCVGLSGCQWGQPPEYKVADLRFDRGLVGRWNAARVPGILSVPHVFQVRSMDVPVSESRINQSGASFILSGFSTNSKSRSMKAYEVTVTNLQEKTSTELQAFLIEVGGENLLGFQVSVDELKKANLGMFVMPIHYVARVSISEDEFSLQMPKRMFVWMPYVASSLSTTDYPQPEWDQVVEFHRSALNATEPQTADEEKPSTATLLYTTNDVDQLVAAYEKLMHEPDFWGDEMKFKRAPASPAEVPK